MTARPRVLIVDDDRDNREVVGEWLGDRFAVTLAADGAEALALMSKRRDSYDVLVVDLEMPKLTGWELVDELRRRAIQLPILVISAALDIRERAKAMNAEFLTKPFDAHKLDEKLTRLLPSMVEITP